MNNEFNTIAIIGIGLIGSSIAKGVKEYNLCSKIIIIEKNPDNLKLAKQLKLGDYYFSKPNKKLLDADLIIISVHLSDFLPLLPKLKPFLKEGCIVSDVGSIKETIINQVQEVLPSNICFIPAHPIAGTEKSGPASGKADLFRNKYFLITPFNNQNQDKLKKFKSFWQKLGAKVEDIDPTYHDRILAATSHLPHLIAYALVGSAGGLQSSLSHEMTLPANKDKKIGKDVIKYSASGFKDLTRIADSNPKMWSDIFVANKDNVLEMLSRFLEDLLVLQRAIRWEDKTTLEEWFKKTKAIHREIKDLNKTK